MNTFCTYFNQNICRSCTNIETSYLDQIKHKERTLLESLSLSDLKLRPTVLSAHLGFRNKAKFSVTGTLENPIIGLTGENTLDLGREILDCPLHFPEINVTAKRLISLIQDSKLIPYSISEKKGELKGIIIFYSDQTQEMYVRLVLRSKESLDRIKKHLNKWLIENPSVKCVSANIQPLPHAILEGDEEVHLGGKQSITLGLEKFSMEVGPKGFVQTNQSVARKLYQEASDWVQEVGASKFLELFCGQGAFSFFVQDRVIKAMGIEINPDAIKQAQQTCKKLNLTHLEFIAKDAKDVKAELHKFAPDILLVNPPRRGLGESLDLVLSSGSPYIIYSSCSIESLAKDINFLSTRYSIEKARIFDMFPHTKHFETLVLLKISDV